MSVYRVAYRYANSLFGLLLEKAKDNEALLDETASNVNLVYNTLEASKELRAILKNPVVKQSDKKAILHSIFENKTPKLIIDFIDFVLEKNRQDILKEIMREFLSLYDEKKGILRTRVTTAVEIPEDLKKELKDNLEKVTRKNVIPSYSIDEKILGGFQAQYGDTIIDASVKSQLERLRKKLSEDISLSNN
jgi:F-type H+-transporting ATPase subunit delta